LGVAFAGAVALELEAGAGLVEGEVAVDADAGLAVG
jgi:hypothetical protein